MDLQRLLQNRDLQTNLFIIFVAISLIQFFETKLLLSVMVIILIIVNTPKMIDMTSNREETKDNIKRDELGEDMYYNTQIHDLLEQLRYYKKYNKVSYKHGVKYMRQYFRILKILEKDNLQNRNQYFDLAKDYLKQSINHFQSITVSMPERSYIDGLKYGDFEESRNNRQLSTLLKQLHKECMAILLNIGITFNKEWLDNPNTYTKEIDLNSGGVENYNKNDEVNWALY